MPATETAAPLRTNPVAQLTPEAYLQLMRLIVKSERMLHGRLQTKTVIELGAWLDVLEGRSTKEAYRARFERPFDLQALIALKLSGVTALAYLRMVEEAYPDETAPQA
jgi:hypothetical protein